jgi:HEPN domain-containing protein
MVVSGRGLRLDAPPPGGLPGQCLRAEPANLTEQRRCGTFWYNGSGSLSGGSATVNRAELQRLAKERISDAKVLLDARHWSGAYYMAGYAAECGLKACIAKLMKAEEFPDRAFAEKCWTHNLPQLLGLAGLKPDLEAAMRADTDLADNWDAVKEWTESSRYARSTKADAEELFEALTERKHGVLPWVKQRW